MPCISLNDLPQSKENSVPSSTFQSISSNKPQGHATLVDKLETSIQDSQVATSLYPVVKLETERISDVVAGKLASSLLGHILFLKNQVPLPILQLARMSQGKTNSRAQKLRSELLNSYDTISSHLDTTFTALSTALARAAEEKKSGTDQAFMAFLVGPSIGSSKTKVILGIDGIETRVWGTRDDPVAPDLGDTQSDSEGDDDINASDEGEAEDLEDSDTEGPEESDDEPSDEESDEEDEDDSTHSSPPSSASAHISHAEEQKFLQNAERLLSRTLAAADSEGNGIISEMSPTQTHILIRAPRRFVHPAWIPRRNVTATLDAALDQFLKRSDSTSQEAQSKRPNNTNTQKVEGVWITTRSGLQKSSVISSMSGQDKSPSSEGDDNDMLWWSWEGKFVGFSDW